MSQTATGRVSNRERHNAAVARFKARALEEIQRLNTYLLSTEAQFKHIDEELVRFDKLKKYVNDKGEVQELQPKWNSYCRRYQDTLTSTRRKARRACAKVKEYSDILTIPESGEIDAKNVIDIRKRLKNLKERVVDLEKSDAVATRSSFNKLAEDLGKFAAEFESALSRAGVDLGDELQATQGLLPALEEELQTVINDNRVAVIAMLTDRVGSAGANSLTFALYTLCPNSLNKAASLNKPQAEQPAALRAKIKQHVDSIDRLITNNTRLEAYKHSLKGTHKDVHVLKSTEDVISRIWVSLSSDMDVMISKLQDATNLKPQSPFQKKVDHVRELTAVLAAVLKEYGWPSTNSENNRALPKREEAVPTMSDMPKERVKENIRKGSIEKQNNNGVIKKSVRINEPAVQEKPTINRPAKEDHGRKVDDNRPSGARATNLVVGAKGDHGRKVDDSRPSGARPATGNQVVSAKGSHSHDRVDHNRLSGARSADQAVIAKRDHSRDRVDSNQPSGQRRANQVVREDPSKRRDRRIDNGVDSAARGEHSSGPGVTKLKVAKRTENGGVQEVVITMT